MITHSGFWPPKKKRYNYGHESGVRSIIELRKDDLSAMESMHLCQGGRAEMEDNGVHTVV